MTRGFLASLAITAGALAQTAGPLDLSWNTIDGGGGIVSGRGFGLAGTIGQPDAGVLTDGGGLTMVGGLWGPPVTLPGVMLGGLVRGDFGRTLRVLCMGNSRTARPTGFAFDGFEEILYEQGRLAGNGFVTPLYGVEQTQNDVRFLFNAGPSMTPTDASWRALDPVSVLHAHSGPALRLVAGRTLKMANFGKSVAILRRHRPLELTVQHLLGPDRGVYRVVPVEVSGQTTVVRSHPAVEIVCAAPTFRVGFTRITLPPMVEPSLNRAVLLEGIAGECTVFALNAERDAAGGVSVSEMAAGGEGYPLQAEETNCPAESWTAFVAAAEPDVVFWFHAANQGLSGVAEATRTLMDRVASVNPRALHLLVIENPTPRSNSARKIDDSRAWAAELEGYRGAIVIDPNPFLPPAFTALQGTGQYGDYFLNNVHENRLGARVVADAIWEALGQFAGR